MRTLIAHWVFWMITVYLFFGVLFVYVMGSGIVAVFIYPKFVWEMSHMAACALGLVILLIASAAATFAKSRF